MEKGCLSYLLVEEWNKYENSICNNFDSLDKRAEPR